MLLQVTQHSLVLMHYLRRLVFSPNFISKIVSLIFTENVLVSLVGKNKLHIFFNKSLSSLLYKNWFIYMQKERKERMKTELLNFSYFVS